MKRERLTITLSKDILSRLEMEIDGRKIRNRSHAIESFLAEKFQNKLFKKAVILGGGKELDIRGKNIPKLLLPINGKTLLEHNIEILKKCGITDLILSLGKLGNKIRKEVQDGSKYGIKVIYFERDYGNASVLRQAKSLLNETFLMMNGDIFLKNIDLNDLYNFHKSNNAQATIAVTVANDPYSLGSIIMKGNHIIEFKEKLKNRKKGAYLINAGVYLMEPPVCEMVKIDNPSLEYHLFPALTKEEKLYGYILNGEWLHLHDKKRYNSFIKLIKKNNQ